MPSTKEIVTRINALVKGWNRDGTKGILPVLNEVHRYMMSHDCEQNEYIDGSTGLPPLLSTTAGVYQYSLPSTARKHIQVMVEDTCNDYDDYGYYREVWWQGEKYKEVPVRSRPTKRNTAGYIIFRDDPGTHSDRYYWRYYLLPTDITAESVDLDIEEKFHDLVIDGVVARIRQVEYGDSEPYLIWRNQRVPDEYWDSQNDNETKSNFINLRYM